MTKCYVEKCLAIFIAITTLLCTEVSSLKCYQCFASPPPGENYTSSQRLCSHFDHSDKFIVDCPFSTMCMKKIFYIDIQNEVRVTGVERDCAFQKDEYRDYVSGAWLPKVEIREPYSEGCHVTDDQGQRISNSRKCFCRSDVCNAAPPSNHEGYTDIMGVIVVFNLMKYINSLR